MSSTRPCRGKAACPRSSSQCRISSSPFWLFRSEPWVSEIYDVLCVGCNRKQVCSESVWLVFQFVFSSFWSIYSYDRELVFPKALDDIIPTWLNHALVSVDVTWGLGFVPDHYTWLLNWYYYYIIKNKIKKAIIWVFPNITFIYS